MVKPNRRDTGIVTIEKMGVKKILVLIPHADDELVGCYQIARQSQAQVSGYYFGFISNDVSRRESADARRKELEKSADRLGIRLTICAENPVEEIRDLLMNETWDLICVPNFIDWHPEHIKVNDILLKAMEGLGERRDEIKVLTYQVSVPLLESGVTHYSVMTKKEQEQKWRLFREIYRTQDYIPVLRFILNERISGKLTGAFAAEVYTVYPFKDYKRMLERWEKIDKSELKSGIDNIFCIRRMVKKYGVMA
jgi:hypothetical protein